MGLCTGAEAAGRRVTGTKSVAADRRVDPCSTGRKCSEPGPAATTAGSGACAAAADGPGRHNRCARRPCCPLVRGGHLLGTVVELAEDAREGRLCSVVRGCCLRTSNQPRVDTHFCSHSAVCPLKGRLLVPLVNLLLLLRLHLLPLHLHRAGRHGPLAWQGCPSGPLGLEPGWP